MDYESLFSLKSRINTEQYFKFKQKNGYSFSESEKKDFFSTVLAMLANKDYWQETEELVIPETSNQSLLELAQLSGKKVNILYKYDKEYIKSKVCEQPMMKAEREKLCTSIEAMEKFKMAGIAGNQRKRFINFLFKPLQESLCNYVFLDDSLFSGYTFKAAQHCLHHPHRNIILFDKS